MPRGKMSLSSPERSRISNLEDKVDLEKGGVVRPSIFRHSKKFRLQLVQEGQGGEAVWD